MSPDRSFFVKTFGCQMNYADAQRLREKLIGEGWKEVSADREASHVFVFTCSVREKAAQKCLSYLGKLNRMGVETTVLSCLVNHMGIEMKNRWPHFNYVPTERLEEFCRPEVPGKIADTVSYVVLTRGCNYFCTYCIVPYLRGRVLSRNPETVLEEVKRRIRNGAKEIFLLGQNVLLYEKFYEVLESVNSLEGDFWVKILTSHPKDLTESHVKFLRSLPHFTPLFHLPFQSGSNKILKRMGRRYTKEEYLEKVAMVREYFPDATVTTDVIIGFPGEKEEDFEETLGLLEEVKPHFSFIFKYSMRDPAKAGPTDVPPETITRRFLTLQKAQEKITSALLAREVGKTFVCLGEERSPDGKVILRTHNYLPVIAKGGKYGEFQRVKIADSTNWTLRGEVVKDGEKEVLGGNKLQTVQGL